MTQTCGCHTGLADILQTGRHLTEDLYNMPPSSPREMIRYHDVSYLGLHIEEPKLSMGQSTQPLGGQFSTETRTQRCCVDNNEHQSSQSVSNLAR